MIYPSAKASHIFQNIGIFEKLTSDVVSFEQPDPDFLKSLNSVLL